MSRLALSLDGEFGGTSGLTVLCLGAHADDIEIGCGGTMLELLRRRDDVTVHWVVFSASGEREVEARSSAARFLQGCTAHVETHAFRDGFLPHQGAELKVVFEGLKAIEPDLIFTHHTGDRHQDHRTVAELTWQTFRHHFVLEYEIPMYDGDLASPNVFVPLEADASRRKVEILMEEFPSQRTKRWFTEETFRALLRLRAIESPTPTDAAEAFYGRKVALRLG